MEFTGRKLRWDPYVTAKRELRARVSKSACDAVDERMKKPLSGGRKDGRSLRGAFGLMLRREFAALCIENNGDDEGGERKA